MRSIKELLELLLINQQYFTRGLCHWIECLYRNGIISYEESCHLIKYVNNHRPSRFSSFTAWKQRKSDFFWPRGDIKPRLVWIHKCLRKQ